MYYVASLGVALKARLINVCVCVYVCLYMEEKERRVLGIEWLLSAVHKCIGFLNAYAQRPALPPNYSN